MCMKRACEGTAPGMDGLARLQSPLIPDWKITQILQTSEEYIKRSWGGIPSLKIFRDNEVSEASISKSTQVCFCSLCLSFQGLLLSKCGEVNLEHGVMLPGEQEHRSCFFFSLFEVLTSLQALGKLNLNQWGIWRSGGELRKEVEGWTLDIPRAQGSCERSGSLPTCFSRPGLGSAAGNVSSLQALASFCVVCFLQISSVQWKYTK